LPVCTSTLQLAEERWLGIQLTPAGKRRDLESPIFG